MNSPVSLVELSKDWLNLSRPYRPSAFWFWNSDMNRERMREVIAEMKRNDIREFLIHPVHGMEVEYLSDEYFELYRYALALAKEHDIKVWVYDEYSWPSGNVGGLLLREHPEHRGWYLRFERDDQGNVTAEPMQSDRVMDSTTGAPWTRDEAGYLDTLSPEAVRCYIEMTHERIRSECGELFDETVAGFFNDEPVCMIDMANGIPGGWLTVGMPWTPALPAKFKERFGYDIEPRYVEMAGDGPSQVKRDYWALVKDMYSKAYHGQIGRWCRAHGVKFTGHLGEDFPLMQVRFAGSPFGCLQHMDEPGIDLLNVKPEPEHRFVEQALISSIAKHSGKDRVYCEAFGISPFSIRLSEMLQCAQMLGTHGINDIALMGFQQSIDGVRKRTYWPPIFDQAPWWEFYGEFRDSFARSVALTSLGRSHARYAILYPQNQLEQTDLFYADIWRLEDPGSVMMNRLGRSIYDAGETFDFVFPEILDQARVTEGKIAFPHASYDAILAPSDVEFFDESTQMLSDLQRDGGRVIRESTESATSDVSSASPSWIEHLSIDGDWPGNIRVYRFDFADGLLFALRNVSDEAHCIRVGSDRFLCEWNTEDGTISSVRNGSQYRLGPHSMLYLTVSGANLGQKEIEQDYSRIPVETQWSVSTHTPNTARLADIRFLAGDTWVEAQDAPLHAYDTSRYATGLPLSLRGETSIKMCGEFTCGSLPDSLSILFEGEHLSALEVNGHAVDLSAATPLRVWDQSCMAVDIRRWASEGGNKISAVIEYKDFETSTVNDGFLSTWCMPSCDVFLCGSFRLIDGIVIPDSGSALSLPIDLSTEGWRKYDGILSISGRISVDSQVADSVVGIQVDLLEQDCLQVLLDGTSLGRRIVAPYLYGLDGLEPGKHTITLRVSGTSGNLLAGLAVWGVNSVKLLCRQMC